MTTRSGSMIMGRISKAASIYQYIDRLIAALEKRDKKPDVIIITDDQLKILNQQAHRTGPSFLYRSVLLVTRKFKISQIPEKSA